jgi:hypothetical protein
MRLIGAGAVLAGSASAQGAGFRVRETAGLRRFSFPVRASWMGQAVPLRAQLLENDKPVPAQFTSLGAGAVDVDFNVSIGPWETREYRLQPGDGGSPAGGSVMDKGVTVEQADGVYAVRHGVEFEVPAATLGLLNQVKGGKLSYLRPGSQGLLLNSKDDAGHQGVAPESRVTKRGPLVGAFRFESIDRLPGDRSVKSVVQMDFPRSKSWIEVRWTVEDPARWVSGMTADLNLLLEGAPTLVDFGANNTVYAALKPGQRIQLSAEPISWLVDLGGQAYASGKNSRAEGWAHVMDQQRATAIAVAEFGADTRDRIEVSADGRLRIQRDFLRGGERRLHFWLHFVTMPVQVGAATSPQAMQSPLKVEWE